jgi:bacterioferritin (cytochrome b1)
VDKKKTAPDSKLMDLLNQTLELEYTLIIHYPRIASAIRDVSTKKLAQSLGSASIAHFDTVTNAITKLGGTPRWSFESFPAELDLKKIFQIQLEKEKTAFKLHKQIAGLILGASLRDKFGQLAQEEEFHIQTVEKILSRLE